jgi:ATP-dependent RNA helicase RhlE
LNFEAFNFHPLVSAGIAGAGYEHPTPIQARAIPHIVNGCDVMGLAQTGTGKTAAFVLPILQRSVKADPGGIRTLIIAPTRELAEQIHQTIEILGRQTRIRSVAIYGGVGIHQQIQKLKRADIVVACPGRLLDHIRRHSVDFSQLEVLVLDEADRMLDMGFIPDIRQILKHLPVKRQTLVFSATMPAEIRRLTGTILNDPATVQVGVTAPAATVSHSFYPVAHHLKTALLLNLLENTNAKSVLVFTRTKHRAKSLGKKLMNSGYNSTSLQGNLSQSRRQASLDGFRSGKFKILVATDIAARGIDVARISHVINYDIPSTPDAYIHRIGRTGRAQSSGEAYTFVTGDDQKMVHAINRVMGSKIEQRTLPTFDYGEPLFNHGCCPQETKKSARNFSRRRKNRNRRVSETKSVA